MDVNFLYSADERWMSNSLQFQTLHLQRRKRLCPEHALDICLGMFHSSSEYSSVEKVACFCRRRENACHITLQRHMQTRQVNVCMLEIP